MKFNVDLKQLGDALQYVTGVIERKFTYPILTNVLVEVNADGVVVLRATDHNMSLMAQLEALEVVEPGATTIPGRRSLDVVNSVGADGSIAEVSTISSGVKLTIGRSEFVLATMPANEFPPDVKIVDPVETTLAVDDFLYLLRAASSSMAQNDVRQHLNAALLELTSAHVRAVATDGMIMCICTKKDIHVDTDSTITALIPRKAVHEIVRGFTGQSGSVSVAIGGNALSVEGEQRALTTNLIETKFPAYQKVVPPEDDIRFSCDRTTLVRGISQAATLSDEGLKVFFEVDKDLMKITANTELGDRAEVVIPVDFGENTTNVIFRHDRLQNVLGTFECDEVRFHIPSPTQSIRVDSTEQLDLMFIVSPIRG